MTRVRTSNSLTPLPDALQQEFNSAGTLGNQYIWNGGGYAGETSTIQDVVTPNYRQRRKEGNIIMNSMSLSKEVVTSSGNGYIQIGPHPSWNNGYTIISGNIGAAVEATMIGQVGAFGSDAARCSDIAVINAFKNMNASPVMAGEILADFGKTLSMLRHPFRKATDYATRMVASRNRLMKRKSMTLLKATGQTWLEYRYGWRPLIQDTHEVVRQATKLRAASDRRFQVARGGASSERSITLSIDTKIYSDAYAVVGTRTLTEKVRANAGVMFSTRPSSIGERVSSALGLGARDVLPTAWELVPFSFVADWFVNIGDWLEAISPRSDISVRSSWCTVVTELTSSMAGGTISRSLGTTKFSGTYNSIVRKNISVVRTANPVIPSTPVLKGKLPSTTQQLDALALMSGKISQILRAF